jgi:hypothetical protein
MTSPWPPAPMPPAYEPPKRRKRWPWIAGAALGALVLIGGTATATVALTRSDPVASPSVDTDPAIVHAGDLPTDEPPVYATPGYESPTPVVISITYEVTGGGNGDMTYNADQAGNTSQANEKALPWHYSFTISGDQGDTYTRPYVSVQRKRGDDGTVTCRILGDGVELVKNTASGPYAIATCQEQG